MTKLAYCDTGLTIWQFDTAAPATAPFPIHGSKSNIKSLAFTAAKQFDMVWGPGSFEIRQTTGTPSESLVYKYKSWLTCLRARNVGGAERIYFSAVKPNAAGVYEIYYLKNESPVLYTTVDAQDLTVPNPCLPGAVIHFYAGDFAFDDADTLYLSSGNMSGPAVGLKAGVYRIKGAGPDSVTGTVERIYLGDGPIQGLCYVAPQSLYFLRGFDVVRLDLAKLTETTEVMLPVVDPDLIPRDLTDVKNGFSPTWWWILSHIVIKPLHGSAAALRAAAARRPGPLPPPHR